VPLASAKPDGARRRTPCMPRLTYRLALLLVLLPLVLAACGKGKY
jgi:hypothetical protein